MFRAVIAIVLAAHTAFSLYAIHEVGLVTLYVQLAANAGYLQVLADLAISLGLVCTWMVADARRHGRTVWPYLLATLALGSLSPLIYLLLAPRDQTRRTHPAAHAASV